MSSFFRFFLLFCSGSLLLLIPLAPVYPIFPSSTLLLFLCFCISEAWQSCITSSLSVSQIYSSVKLPVHPLSHCKDWLSSESVSLGFRAKHQRCFQVPRTVQRRWGPTLSLQSAYIVWEHFSFSLIVLTSLSSMAHSAVTLANSCLLLKGLSHIARHTLEEQHHRLILSLFCCYELDER